MHGLLEQTFRPLLRSANAKSEVSELSSAERLAILFFAGVPYNIDPITGTLTFNKAALIKTSDGWTIGTQP